MQHWAESDVAVIVPAYNEAEVIADVVAEIVARFPLCIVVDDGSTDDTVAEARRGGAQVVKHDLNLGQGAALQTGLSAALMFHSVRWIVTFDADGQHRVEDAERLVAIAKQNADTVDVVLGSRFLVGGSSEAGWFRRVMLRWGTVYTRAATGLAVTDTHNGLRVVGRPLAVQLRLKEPRMAHATELLHQISQLQARYQEEPVSIRYTDYSRSKGQPLINSVTILFDSVFRR